VKIHGDSVLGDTGDINSIAQRVKADEALITLPSANSQQMRRFLRFFEKSDLNFKTILGLDELINGKVTANAIRELAYRNLAAAYDVVRFVFISTDKEPCVRLMSWRFQAAL
jgi:FlaA1/EpsC-like NDP-sugar epimerase